MHTTPNHSFGPCLRRSTMFAAAFLATLCSTACVSREPPPEAIDARYEGPKLTLDSSGPQHTLKMDAPTAGWQVVVDRVVERHRVQDVFLTIRRPDPRFHFKQVPVTQIVAVPVPSSQTVRISARTLDAETSSTSVGRQYPIVIAPKPSTSPDQASTPKR